MTLRNDCVFFVSNKSYGNYNDQVSNAVPSSYLNGKRFNVSDLNSNLQNTLGSFTPSDIPQTEADALIAFGIATN